MSNQSWQLPLHWANRGNFSFSRSDGVQVQLSLEESEAGRPEAERKLGWLITLPLTPQKNGGKTQTHFLSAASFPTLGSILRKVDQEWAPPAFLQVTFPKAWMGSDLEQLAREAPSK